MPAVRFEFVATGYREVDSAFKGTVRSAQEAERAIGRVGTTSTRTGRAATSGASATKAAEERRWREVEKAGAKIERQFAREAQAADRAANQKIKSEERAANQRVKAEERAQKQVAAVRDRSFAQAQRQQEKDDAKSARNAEKAAARQSKAAQRVADDRARSFSGLGREAVGLAKGAALAVGALGVGIVGAAARDESRKQSAARRLSINSRGAGAEAVDPNVLRHEAEATAKRTPGIGASDVLEAQTGFVGKTGRLDLARQFSDVFATVASATGASIQDVANAGADLTEKFDIKTIDGMRDAMAALTFQGKEGSFELKDAAAQFGGLAAAAARFGLDKGAKGVATLGGLTQIAKSGTKSPEQAATAVEAMFRQLISKSPELGKLGASPFVKGSKTQTRDIQDVLVDVISKTKGELPALQGIFQDEGLKGVTPLITTFNRAKDGTNGTEEEKIAAGVKALRAQLDKSINATGAWSEMTRDAAAAQQDSSAQLSNAWERLTTKVGGAVLPILESWVTKLAGNEAALDTLAGTAANVAKGLGFLGDVLMSLPGVGDLFRKDVDLNANAQKAQKELDDYQATMPFEGVVNTPAQAKKIDALTAARDAANEALMPKAKPGEKTNAKEVFKALSLTEYTSAMAGAIGSDTATDVAGRAAVGSLLGPIAAAGMGGSMSYMNAEQKKIKAQQEMAVGANKQYEATKAPELDVSKAQKSIDDFAFRMDKLVVNPTVMPPIG